MCGFPASCYFATYTLKRHNKKPFLFALKFLIAGSFIYFSVPQDMSRFLETTLLSNVMSKMMNYGKRRNLKTHLGIHQHINMWKVMEGNIAVGKRTRNI